MIVVPRIVTRSQLCYGWPTPIFVELFFPHDQVRPGNVACWDGCHNEASADYYARTRRPRTEAERTAAARAVAQYRGFVASLPVEVREPVDQEDRFPRGWRTVAWSR